MSTPATGYLHAAYAECFSEFGTPRALPSSGGWIIERPINGSSRRDAMGCYPLFCCNDWSQLHLDLEEIGNRLVSLTVVTDPFGNYTEEQLGTCFKDVVIPFKEHFVVDLSLPIPSLLSSKIRYRLRKALRSMEIAVSDHPMEFLDDWIRLYEVAVDRFKMRSIQAFSREAFTKMFSVPGLLAYRASARGETIGMALVFVQKEVAFGHLISVTEAGYSMDASYALYGYQIEHLSGQCRWLDLGGVPGIPRESETKVSGLRQYKAHWATETRMSYLCGRILDPRRYAEIMRMRGVAATDYFPAYRSGEFA